MITRGELADGTPATFCKFDVQRHHVPTLLAQDLVPTICGVVLQRDIENKRVVKSMVMSIALVPRKQSTNPHCDMWPLDSNGNRFDTLVRKSVAAHVAMPIVTKPASPSNPMEFALGFVASDGSRARSVGYEDNVLTVVATETFGTELGTALTGIAQVVVKRD